MTTFTLTTAVILVLSCAYSWRTGDCRTLNCLFSRLDSFNCTPPEANTSWPWPGPNKYALYRTRIGRDSRSSPPYCNYRPEKKYILIRDIDFLGDQNVRLLYSPGYLLGRGYANQMLVSYNVECPEGRLPFLEYKDVYLRGTVCHGRCEDYVTISTTLGTSESCGQEPTDNFYHLGQRLFSVTFRTSRANNGKGFELSVICFDPINMNKAVLSNLGDKKKRDLEIYDNMRFEEAKRSRRQVDQNLSLSDVLTYRNNTINVMREFKEDVSIDNIDCLVIEDTSGVGRLFLNDAVELLPDGTRETILLRGPGELRLVSNNATFIRNSKAFTPPEFEQTVVTELTNELFSVIPQSNDPGIPEIPLDEEDKIDETTPTASQLQVLSHLSGRRSAELYEDEPDFTISQPRVPSHSNHRRSAVRTPSPHCLISTSAIRLALLHVNSSYPVVSTIATSVVNIATRQSPIRVQRVRNSLSRTPC